MLGDDEAQSFQDDSGQQTNEEEQAKSTSGAVAEQVQSAGNSLSRSQVSVV